MTPAPARRITPFLWFDGTAEPAMNFYVSVFPNSKVLSASPMMVSFELCGQRFYGLIPKALGRLLGDPDRVRAGRVMEAMLTMGKIDIAGLQRAYDG